MSTDTPRPEMRPVHITALVATLAVGGLAATEGSNGPGHVLLLAGIALGGIAFGARGALAATTFAWSVLAIGAFWGSDAPASTVAIAIALVGACWYIVGLGSVALQRQRTSLAAQEAHARNAEEAAERARRAELLSRQLMDGLPTGVIAVDDDGNVERTNPAALSWFTETYAAHANRALHTLLRSGRRQIDVEIGDRWVSASSTRHPGGTLVTLRDVTDRVRSEADVKRALRTARQANEAQQRFLAAMSHEVRTPLNAVIGYTEFLADGAAASEVEDLDRILDAGRHLLALVDDLLLMGEGAAPELDLETLRVADLCTSVLDTARPVVEAGGNRLEFDLPERSLTLRTDARRAKQVLLNLLSNAAKVTTNGTVALTVTVEDDVVLLAVRDTGPGIPAHRFSELFRPFQQLSPDDRKKGTGLGLPLSQRLARLLGGRLRVSSEVDEGSTFTLELPRVRR